MSPVPRLKKRRDFLRVAAHQRKAVTPTMIVQLAERSLIDKKGYSLPVLRIGFTTSRKVGNAVERNRARRRLRSLVQIMFLDFSFSREDMVIIARPAIIKAPFSSLQRDLYQALSRLEVLKS